MVATQSGLHSWGRVGPEGDLATTACRAAIELDDLILERASSLDHVQALSSLLSPSSAPTPDSEEPFHFISPTTVVVVHRAIDDTGVAGQRLDTVGELLKEAARIGDQLKVLAAGPVTGMRPNGVDLAQMRAFCVALSRRAEAEDMPLEERFPAHPHRR